MKLQPAAPSVQGTTAEMTAVPARVIPVAMAASRYKCAQLKIVPPMRSEQLHDTAP
jgi:hypothetical protein